MIPPSLGSFIRTHRLKQGLTQAQVGKATGYSSQFIANWERGASAPPMTSMRKLILLLQIPARDMIVLLSGDYENYWNRLLSSRPRRSHGRG